MREFILRAKCRRLTQNKNSCNRVVRPLRDKTIHASLCSSFYIFTFAKEEWPYYQIPMEELCDATQFSDGCGGHVRECAARYGQDPYGNRKKHSSSTTASVVTNHSFWEEEAFRCLYYTEKNSPRFAPRDSATSQLHTRTRLITDRFSDSWPAVHICIWECQL